MSLRALMIAPTPFFGDRGCHIRILEEIRALQSADATVELLCYPAGKDVPGVTIRRVESLKKYSAEKIGPDYLKFPLDAALFAKAVSRARVFEPDIIHGHLHEGGLIGAVVGKMFGIPSVFDYQGSLSGELEHHRFVKKGSALFAAFAAAERVINSLPSLVLCSSKIMTADKKDSPRGPEWIHLPDAIDPAFFKPLEKNAKLAAELKLPPGKPVCVFLGLLNSYQGVDLLLESVAAVKSKYGDAMHFLIMGYPNVDEYRAKAQTMGIGGMTTFPGRIPYGSAPEYLCLGDIAVAPKIALTESNGKLIDYMACGLPTAAIDGAVNRELLGDAGVFVPWRGNIGETAAHFADALIGLARNENEKRKLRDIGIERVRKYFTNIALRDNLLAAYDKVLRKK